MEGFMVPRVFALQDRMIPGVGGSPVVRSTYHVILEEAPEGGYTARCVEIPGAISEGATPDEAVRNVGDAIESIIHVRRSKAQSLTRRGPASLKTVVVDG